MTGRRYIDEVLLPHVRLSVVLSVINLFFMDDNATYINPIENVWDALGEASCWSKLSSVKQEHLIHALTVKWDKLPQQMLDNVQSMVRRVECCITLYGGHIPY
ncbi:hypothetical protein TNCV_2714001 [Trichonephila clavipes]|nr:hypothetical protein TNCV_2714001 [Trichonephila clavipes]